MLKYFFKVIYKTRDCCEYFDLGVFSSLKNAQRKILFVSSKVGFSQWEKGFKILKIGVRFKKNDKIEKSNLILYSITHLSEIEENQLIYDVYKDCKTVSTLEDAESEIEFLKAHTRYGKKHPDGFQINEIIVDNYTSWSEGFDNYDS